MSGVEKMYYPKVANELNARVVRSEKRITDHAVPSVGKGNSVMESEVSSLVTLDVINLDDTDEEELAVLKNTGNIVGKNQSRIDHEVAEDTQNCTPPGKIVVASWARSINRHKRKIMKKVIVKRRIALLKKRTRLNNNSFCVEGSDPARTGKDQTGPRSLNTHAISTEPILPLENGLDMPPVSESPDLMIVEPENSSSTHVISTKPTLPVENGLDVPPVSESPDLMIVEPENSSSTHAISTKLILPLENWYVPPVSKSPDLMTIEPEIFSSTHTVSTEPTLPVENWLDVSPVSESPDLMIAESENCVGESITILDDDDSSDIEIVDYRLHPVEKTKRRKGTEKKLPPQSSSVKNCSQKSTAKKSPEYGRLHSHELKSLIIQSEIISVETDSDSDVNSVSVTSAPERSNIKKTKFGKNNAKNKRKKKIKQKQKARTQKQVSTINAPPVNQKSLQNTYNSPVKCLRGPNLDDHGNDMSDMNVLLREYPYLAGNMYIAENPFNLAGLRPVIIDGGDVCFKAGKFMLKSLLRCVLRFLEKGHRIVRVFLSDTHRRVCHSSPMWADLCNNLVSLSYLIFVPHSCYNRNGKHVDMHYEYRVMLQYATEIGGVIVTNTDLSYYANGDPGILYTIQNRIIGFNWINDVIIFHKDQYGRGGPDLETILKFNNC